MKGLIKDEPILQLIAELCGYDDIEEYLDDTVGFVGVMLTMYSKIYKVLYIEEDCYVELDKGYCWPIEAVILMED